MVTLQHDPHNYKWVLRENTPGERLRNLNHWNPSKCRVTNERELLLPDTDKQEVMEAYLKQDGVRIYSVLSHLPVSNAVRVSFDGEDYIDEFGRYVYIRFGIGQHEDIDLRYAEDEEPIGEMFPIDEEVAL